MEGSLAGAYSVLDGPAYSSWTFSIPKVGEPIQHYSLEKIPWHAGLPGDRRHDTSLIGNLTLIGKEHEGGGPNARGEPWTENQTYWSARIDVAVRVLCPVFGANPPTLRLNEWEHRWLSATSCPSGRNPWEAKFALITEWEDEMNQAEFNRMFKQAVEDVGFPSQDADGNSTSGAHSLVWWTELFRAHQENQGKHKHGEGAEHDHSLRGRTGKA
jgi:hypothetical protein